MKGEASASPFSLWRRVCNAELNSSSAHLVVTPNFHVDIPVTGNWKYWLSYVHTWIQSRGRKDLYAAVVEHLDLQSHFGFRQGLFAGVLHVDLKRYLYSGLKFSPRIKTDIEVTVPFGGLLREQQTERA